ncbi:MAG: phosphotransferase [Syntrophaceae bacterium]|nr:phosphotransferase [Syntrophaceae bacterium]
MNISGVVPDATIAGSPERTLQRMVVMDSAGWAFILAEVSLEVAGRKREIAAMLMSLSISGLTRVHPCLPDKKGNLITVWNDRYWQLRTYVPGVPLPRPEYLDQSWRGEALADFLIDLRKAVSRTEHNFAGEIFSIVHFIKDFMRKLAMHNPDVLCELIPARDYLAVEFFPVHNRLPPAFCHGDYHPMNVVWSEKAILSVIDWEFCGFKPEAYDLALLFGCLGIEDPQALKGPLVRSLMARIRESGIYDDLSLTTLPDLVIALRFAWLSDWLRRKDWDMVRLELDYLRLLLVNRTVLSSAWRDF